jgi:hypothetical protein
MSPDAEEHRPRASMSVEPSGDRLLSRDDGVDRGDTHVERNGLAQR